MSHRIWSLLLGAALLLSGCKALTGGTISDSGEKPVGECKLSYGSKSDTYPVISFAAHCDDLDLGGKTWKIREMIVVGPYESTVEDPNYEEPLEVVSFQFAVRLPEDSWKDGEYKLQSLKGEKLDVVEFDVEGDIQSWVVLPKTEKDGHVIKGGSFTMTEIGAPTPFTDEYEETLTTWDVEAEVELESKDGKSIRGTVKGRLSGY